MLSEEEKKVINYLENEYKKLEEEGNILFPLYKHQTKIVLNLINKLQKENEEKDIYIKHSEEITTEMNNDINKLLSEIKEKDKQINLMAFNIADYVMYYEYDKCRNPEMIKSKANEIKQYFEKKAKEGEKTC